MKTNFPTPLADMHFFLFLILNCYTENNIFGGYFITALRKNNCIELLTTLRKSLVDELCFMNLKIYRTLPDFNHDSESIDERVTSKIGKKHYLIFFTIYQFNSFLNRHSSLHK